MKITVVVGPAGPEKSKKIQEVIAGRRAMFSAGQENTDNPFWLLDLCMRARKSGNLVLALNYGAECNVNTIIRAAILLPNIVDLIVESRILPSFALCTDIVGLIDIFQMPASGEKDWKDEITKTSAFKDVIDNILKQESKPVKRHKAFEDIVTEIEKFFKGDLVVKELSVEEFQKAKNDMVDKDMREAANRLKDFFNANMVVEEKKPLLCDTWAKEAEKNHTWERLTSILSPIGYFVSVDLAGPEPEKEKHAGKHTEATTYMSGLDNKLYKFVLDNKGADGDCLKCAFKGNDPNCTLQGEDCLNHQGYWVLAGKL